ncbi:MAG: hypothetical protein M1511_15555 [Deltaproteobacteria bacterium]|nr:hypothetical protein [Deltaproteobacteria bacterium]
MEVEKYKNVNLMGRLRTVVRPAAVCGMIGRNSRVVDGFFRTIVHLRYWNAGTCGRK